MKIIVNLLIFQVLFAAFCTATERDDLLRQLDEAINNRQHYMDQKERRIDMYRHSLTPYTSPEERYTINNHIYNEYKTYRYDSALLYVNRNRELAEELGVRKYQDETAINLSMLLSTTGMYRESIDNLKRIDRQRLDSSLLAHYYYICEWTYYEATEYTNDSFYAPEYQRIERLYIDSVFSVLDPGTPHYEYYRGKRLLKDGQLEDALNIFLALYPEIGINTRLYAIVTYDIANIYNRFGNQNQYEKFLILATISDQVTPLKENLAGQELSLYLFRNKPNDLDRSYRYIQCSMDDARFYNNRLRMVQMSEKLPIIVQAYHEKSAKEKARITIAFFAITLLSLATIALLGYVYKQMKLVKRNRREVEALNVELSQINLKLNEANHTKGEYVGLFIDLCSSYIEKLDKYRETVKRKLIAKQIDDLYNMVNSTRNIEMELNDFFRSFDSAFLKLYPTFINDFNNLLLPDEKIQPKKGEVLNRELRIFALIRLGIHDSSRIASFMRYSSQTIYNNRTKVRNKARDRDNFEKQVMGIGI